MKTLLLASLLVAPLAVGMVAPAAGTAAPAEEAVTMGMELTVGKSGSVILDGNPTTGYTWNIVSVSSDAVKAETKIIAPEMKAGEPPLCGAPAPTQITFTGVKPGKCKVVAEYKRTWETETPADKTIIFEISVSAE